MVVMRDYLDQQVDNRVGRALAPGVLGASALVTALATALAVLAAWVTARSVSAPGPREKKFVTPWELEVPYEEVGFVTEDGLTLRGWWLPNPDAKRTVVLFHGHRGARHHSVGIGTALRRRGANVLLFDHRGRGSSEGESVSLGYFELRDAAAAVDYALSQAPGLPLGLVGYSMGAAVALMITARDSRVGAVVADSPFASERALMRNLVRKRLGPPGPLVAALSEIFLPYDPGEVRPLREVGGIAPRATLFIHGLSDATCEPQDSLDLYGAAGEPKGLWLLEGAGHCDAYFVDRAAYCERVAAFFEEHLRRSPAGSPNRGQYSA